MSLKNYDECIRDSFVTRDTLVDQIKDVIAKSKEPTDTITAVAAANELLAATRGAITTTTKQNGKSSAHSAILRASLAARREAIFKGHKSQEESTSHLTVHQRVILTRLHEAQSAEQTISGHVHRVCEELARIFPIEAVEGRPLHFTILGCYLPNAKFNDPAAVESVTATALGYVAFILTQLSNYLSIALPYPLTALGSTSTVSDPISIHVAKTSRIYPLYQTGSIPFRFDYAVFLLNKDLETLLAGKGLSVIDLRHTLANLKYLLTVLGGGLETLPMRKVGGVKGLFPRNEVDAKAEEMMVKGQGASRLEKEEEEEEEVDEGRFLEGQKAEGVQSGSEDNRVQEEAEQSEKLPRVTIRDTSHGSGFASRNMARKWLERWG